MGTLGNFELPASISPCLRLFIESLFPEVDVACGASLRQTQGFQSSLVKANDKESSLEYFRRGSQVSGFAKAC